MREGIAAVGCLDYRQGFHAAPLIDEPEGLCRYDEDIVGIEAYRPLQMRQGIVGPLLEDQRMRDGDVAHALGIVERDRLTAEIFRYLQASLVPVEEVVVHVEQAQACVGHGKARVDLDRLQ